MKLEGSSSTRAIDFGTPQPHRRYNSSSVSTLEWKTTRVYVHPAPQFVKHTHAGSTRWSDLSLNGSVREGAVSWRARTTRRSAWTDQIILHCKGDFTLKMKERLYVDGETVRNGWRLSCRQHLAATQRLHVPRSVRGGRSLETWLDKRSQSFSGDARWTPLEATIYRGPPCATKDADPFWEMVTHSWRSASLKNARDSVDEMNCERRRHAFRWFRCCRKGSYEWAMKSCWQFVCRDWSSGIVEAVFFLSRVFRPSHSSTLSARVYANARRNRRFFFVCNND